MKVPFFFQVIYSREKWHSSQVSVYTQTNLPHHVHVQADYIWKCPSSAENSQYSSWEGRFLEPAWFCSCRGWLLVPVWPCHPGECIPQAIPLWGGAPLGLTALHSPPLCLSFFVPLLLLVVPQMRMVEPTCIAQSWEQKHAKAYEHEVHLTVMLGCLWLYSCLSCSESNCMSVLFFIEQGYVAEQAWEGNRGSDRSLLTSPWQSALELWTAMVILVFHNTTDSHNIGTFREISKSINREMGYVPPCLIPNDERKWEDMQHLPLGGCAPHWRLLLNMAARINLPFLPFWCGVSTCGVVPFIQHVLSTYTWKPCSSHVLCCRGLSGIRGQEGRLQEQARVKFSVASQLWPKQKLQKCKAQYENSLCLASFDLHTLMAALVAAAATLIQTQWYNLFCVVTEWKLKSKAILCYSWWSWSV